MSWEAFDICVIVISLHIACFAQEESCLGIVVDLLPTGVDVPAQLVQTMLRVSL